MGTTTLTDKMKDISPLWQWRGSQAGVGTELGVRNFEGRQGAFTSWVLENECDLKVGNGESAKLSQVGGKVD